MERDSDGRDVQCVRADCLETGSKGALQLELLVDGDPREREHDFPAVCMHRLAVDVPWILASS